jgi:hypothetical protein
MIKKRQTHYFKTSLFQPDLFSANEIHFHGDETPIYINDNITKLSELQIISDLSTELHNVSAATPDKISKITKILRQSESLYIHGITESLEDGEKSRAAKLIANIITNNPFLKNISLENNRFSVEDLSLIVNAIIDAKQNPLLQTSLNEVHLKKSISTKNAEEIIPKLIILKHKHDMDIDLDAPIADQLRQHARKKP